MPEESNDSKPVHERLARGEKPPIPARRSGFSHSAPGYHDGPSKRPAEAGKQSVRARKRKIHRKED